MVHTGFLICTRLFVDSCGFYENHHAAGNAALVHDFVSIYLTFLFPVVFYKKMTYKLNKN